MNAVSEMEIATIPTGESTLARARLHRQLTTAEAARRAGISDEAVQWLEEGRVYRFPSGDAALVAMLLYTTALGIDHDEALGLAGRDMPPKPLRKNPVTRLTVLAALAAVLVGVVAVVLLARPGGSPSSTAAATRAAPALPAPWTIHVRVLNGSGDIVATRDLASRIQALGYTVTKVGRANNFGYRQTIVYFPPGGDAVALRLAKKLGANTAPLPGGTNPRDLVVVAGPPTISSGG